MKMILQQIRRNPSLFIRRSLVLNQWNRYSFSGGWGFSSCWEYRSGDRKSFCWSEDMTYMVGLDSRIF